MLPLVTFYGFIMHKFIFLSKLTTFETAELSFVFLNLYLFQQGT